MTAAHECSFLLGVTYKPTPSSIPVVENAPPREPPPDETRAGHERSKSPKR